MVKLSTANRISLQIAMLTGGLMLGVGVFVSLFFYQQWRRAEERGLRRPATLRTIPAPYLLRTQRQRIQDDRMISRTPSSAQSIQSDEIDEWEKRRAPLTVTPSMVRRYLPERDGSEGLIKTSQGRRWLIRTHDGRLRVQDVTKAIERQWIVGWAMLWAVIGSIVLSYVVSRLIMRHMLRDLRRLARAVASLSINQLTQVSSLREQFGHLPGGDEIVTIATALDDARARLSRQVDEIQSFVANASHELRTPLMVMRSSLDLAQKTTNYTTLIEQQRTTIGQMEELIAVLLALAYDEYHDDVRQPCAVQSIITDVIQTMRTRYAAQGHDISYNCDNHLTIDAYQGTIDRIIINLVDNACKYSPSGGRIRIDADEIQLVVTDTGPGISASVVDRVWEPFWQEDASRSVDTGYGLGLTLVKRLADLHGRTVVCESKRDETQQGNHGTVMRVYW